MLRCLRLSCLLVTGSFVFAWIASERPLPLQGQVVGSETSPETGVDREKALRYHAALQKRAAPGFLFDRFYDAWLEDGTFAELETFLSDQATASGALNDKLLLAFLHARQGDDVKSLEQFRAALEKHPGNAVAWYEKAVTEARTLDFETALTDLASADAAGPDDDQKILIGQLRASLLVRNRQNEQAVLAWNDLIASRPDDEGLLEDIIEQMISEGLYDEALEKSDALIAVTRDPYQQVVRQMRKGDILQRAGKQPEALQVYAQTMLKIGRDTWLEREMISQIDTLFRREDNLTGLKEQLDELLAAEPDRIALHRASAKLQQQLGNSEAAIEAFKKIIELTPGDRANREAFVTLLADGGQLELAIAQLQTLAEQFSGDAELSMRLAGLQHQGGKPELAAAAINEYLQKSASSEFAFLRAARVLQGFEMPAGARGMYEASVAAFPESITCREAFAAWLYDHEEKPKALEIWRAIAAGGDRSELIRVARILTSHNEHQAAFDLLDEKRSEFANDSVYLGQLIDEAIALDKFSEAAPLALQRVKLSGNALDLDASILQAFRVYSKLENQQTMLDDVRGAADSSMPATCLLAEILESRGQRGEADSLLQARSAAMADTGTLDDEQIADMNMLINQQIRLYSARQNWTQAAAAGKTMIELPRGRNSVNVRRLVDLYLRDGQLDEALQWVGEWKQVSPGSLLPWINESQILSRVGREEESLRVLRAAARKFPSDADLAAMLAEKFAFNGLPQEAERIYWKQFEGSEQLGDRLRWVEQLARLAEMNGTTDKLIATMNERCKSNPESVEPLLALAQVHRIADNFEERRLALLEATRKQPDNLNLMLEIARMEEAEGEWEQALATLENAQSFDTGNKAKQQIARICMGYGDLDRGLQILSEIAGGENADARDVEMIADSLVRADQWERARDYLAPHATRIPDDYRLKYLLATINESLGDEDGAWKAFLALLSAEGLLPGVAVNSSRNMYTAMGLDTIRQSMPPGVVALYQTEMFQSEAYSYREDRRYYSSIFGAAPGNQLIKLPADGDECRQLATCHLLTIAADASEENQESLVGLLTANGINDAKLLVVVIGEEDSIYQISTDLNDEFPDNETLLAVSVMNSMNSPADEELLLKAHEHFASTYPDLAFIAAMQLAMQDPGHHALATSAFENIRTQEQPSELILSALVQMLMSDMGFDSSAETPAELKVLVNDLLIEVYPKLRKSQAMMSGMGGYAFRAIMTAVAQDPDPARLVAFLEAELEQFQKSGKSSAQANPYGIYFSGYPGNESLIAMPSFPPSRLDGLPEEFRTLGGIFGGHDEDDNPFGSPMFNDFGHEHDDSTSAGVIRFRDAAKNISNPLLRAFLQSYIGLAMEGSDELADTDPFSDLRETLAGFAALGKPDLDMMLIEAGLAAHTSQWDEASRILEQGRSLPMTQERRAIIDGALVALATSDAVAGEEFEGIEQVRQSARSAALRLRRGNMDAEQREQLLSILETLGLTTEAEQMEQKMAQAMTQPSGSYSSPPSISMGTSSPERILEMIDSGKIDAATRLLEQQFSALSREILGNVSGYGNNEYEMREFDELVKALKMEKELLASLDPGEAGSDRKLASFALAHERFGDKKKAVELYRAAIEADPRQLACRLRLIAVEFMDDPTVISAQLAIVRERDLPDFIRQLAGLIGEAECSAEQLLAGFEQLVAFAEQQPDDAEENLHWIGTVASALTVARSVDAEPSDRSYVRNSDNPASFLPSIFAKTEVGDDSGTATGNDEGSEVSSDDKEQAEAMAARIKTLVAARRAIHDRACEVAMRCPSVAESAFTSWLTASVAAGEQPESSTVDKARQVLLIAGPAGGGSTPPSMMSYSYERQFGYQRSSSDVVERVSPELFLARHFAAQTPPDQASVDELVGELIAAKKNATSDALNNKFKLYSAVGADFLTAAQQYMEWGSVRNNRDAFDPKLIVDVWSERKLECDLEPVILELARSADPRKNDARTQMLAVAQYCSQIAESRPSVDLPSLIDKIRQELVGSDEELQALVEKADSSRNRSGNSKLESYGWFLGGLAGRIETAIPAIEEAEKYAIEDRNIAQSANGTIRNFLESESDAEKVLNWLQASRFIGTVDEFRPQLAELSLREIFRYERPEDWKCASELVELLDKRPRPAFGDTVLLLFLNEYPGNQEILMELVPELSALEKLEPSRQAALYEFVQSSSSGYDRSLSVGGFEGDAKKIRDILYSAKLAGAGDVLGNVLDAKSLDDLEIEYYNLDEWVTSNMLPFSDTEPERFADSVVHLLTLAEKTSRGSYSSYSGHQLTVKEQLVREMVEGHVRVALLSPLIDMIQHPELGFLAPGEDYLDVQQLFVNGMNEVREELGPAEGTLTVDQFNLFNKKLEAILGDRDPASLLKAMAAIFANHSKSDRMALQASARATSELEGASPLYRTWEYALGLEFPRGSIANTDEENTDVVENSRLEQASPLQQQMLAIVVDESKTLSERFAVAQAMIAGDKQLPLSMMPTCLATVTEAMRDKEFSLDLAIDLIPGLLDITDDQEFAETAGDFGQALERKLLARSGEFQFDMNSFRDAVRLFHRQGKETTITQVVRRTMSEVHDRGSIAILLRLGYTSQARQLIGEVFKDDSSLTEFMELEDESRDIDDYYDSDLATGVTALIDLLPGSGEKYLAELWFASMPDQPGPEATTDDATTGGNNEESADSGRASRMAPLAQRFAESEFKTPIQKEQATILLSQDSDSVSIVADALRESAARLRPVDLWGDVVNEQKRSHNNRLLVANMINGLRSGNSEALELFVSLVGDDSDEDYSKRSAVNRINNQLASILLAEIPEMSEETLNGILPGMRGLSDVGGNDYYNDQQFQSSCLLAHAVAGKADEFVQWRKSKGETDEREYSQGDTDDLWPPVSNFLKSSGASDEKRIEMVFTLWKLASDSGFGVGSGHFQQGIKESCSGCSQAIMGLDAIKEAGLMSSEEIVSNGVALAQINPVDGEIWRQVAWEQVAAEQFEAAEMSFERAVQITTEELEQARNNRSVEYAWILQKNGKAEDAKKQLERIDASMMLGENTERLKQLKSTLE